LSDFFKRMSSNQKHKYTIHYTALPVGEHRYEYQIDGSFFSDYENTAVNNAELTIHLIFNKESERLFELHFHITGTVMVQCDRCLGDYAQKVNVKEVLFVKLGENYLEESEDKIVWPENKPSLDIEPHIHDYVELSIPYHKVHPKNAKGEYTCDPEMVEKLNQYLIDNKEKDMGNSETDPRWDQLRDLLN